MDEQLIDYNNAIPENKPEKEAVPDGKAVNNVLNEEDNNYYYNTTDIDVTNALTEVTNILSDNFGESYGFFADEHLWASPLFCEMMNNKYITFNDMLLSADTLADSYDYNKAKSLLTEKLSEKSKKLLKFHDPVKTTEEELLKNGVPKSKLSHKYIEQLSEIDCALENTYSSHSNDSKEFKSLMNTFKLTFSASGRFFIDKEDFKDYENKMALLKDKASEYIKHCEDHPKMGSRRAERLKQARRVYHVCNAFNYNQNIKEYLVDHIALRYYSAVVYSHSQSLKNPDEKAAFEKEHINAKANRANADKVKEFLPFQQIVNTDLSIEELHRLHEDPFKTLKRINAAATDNEKQKITEFKNNIIKKKVTKKNSIKIDVNEKNVKENGGKQIK